MLAAATLTGGLSAYRPQPMRRRHHGRRASAIAASRSASEAHYLALAFSAVARTAAEVRRGGLSVAFREVGPLSFSVVLMRFWRCSAPRRAA